MVVCRGVAKSDWSRREAGTELCVAHCRRSEHLVEWSSGRSTDFVEKRYASEASTICAKVVQRLQKCDGRGEHDLKCRIELQGSTET